MKYKALITDVDGTLVVNKRDGMPSPKVSEAINKASSLIHICVATSRPLFLVESIANQLMLNGPSIINGGATIIEFPSQRILKEQPINNEDTLKICKILAGLKVSFFIHDNGKDIEYSKEYIPSIPLGIFTRGLTPMRADEIINKISHIPTIVAHKIPAWSKGNFAISISHVSATKQHGILEVAKILNIQTNEIIGVGDGYNDFPLLMACGLKVAMGNAVEDLKAIADYIAPTVEQDGLADVIEKFILQN